MGKKENHVYKPCYHSEHDHTLQVQEVHDRTLQVQEVVGPICCYYDYLWSVVLRIDADAKHLEPCRLEFLASLEGRLSVDSEELRQCKSVLNDVVLKKTLQLRSLLADARKKGTISFQRMVSRILVTDESTGFKTLINGNEFDKVLRERSKLKKGRKKKIMSTSRVTTRSMTALYRSKRCMTASYRSKRW